MKFDTLFEGIERTAPLLIAAALAVFISATFAKFAAGIFTPLLSHGASEGLTTWVGAMGAITAVLSILVAFVGYRRERWREIKLLAVEVKAQEHPEKPQLAWDLARAKLENYLDRNLSQVRWIFFLTLIVMLFGFGFIMVGLFRAFAEPDRLPVAIVASASGVIISFIGGSFLLVYRSILDSAKGYVSVLERINAVGMAVQVIASIPEEGADVKRTATAELARQLLSLYAAEAPAPKKRKQSATIPTT